MIRQAHVRKANNPKVFQLSLGPHTLHVGQKTHLMGIINITPDSFSLDGCFKKDNPNSHPQALTHARKLIREGADIIDLGAESSRPGAVRISLQEELDRLLPTLIPLAKKCPVPISIDTSKTTVARHALDAGAHIINTIKGAQPAKSLLTMIRNYDAGIVLMHMRGTPRTMQQGRLGTHDITQEVLDALKKSIETCLDIGIAPHKIMIDPGIGFGKTVGQNLQLINHLNTFKSLNMPILMGISRKSFIGHVLNKKVHKRLIGSVAANLIALTRGAHILRVHDVKIMKEAVTMADAILNEKNLESYQT